jgi:transposase
MARRKIEITEEVLRELKARKKKENNNKIYRRLLFLEMKSGGLLNQEISLYLDVRMETLSVWTNLFLEGGLNTLCSLQYEGRRVSPLEPIKEKIKKYVEKENISTLKELKKWLETEYDLSFGIAWIQRFCKKNSIFLIKKQD